MSATIAGRCRPLGATEVHLGHGRPEFLRLTRLDMTLYGVMPSGSLKFKPGGWFRCSGRSVDDADLILIDCVERGQGHQPDENDASTNGRREA